MNARVASRTPRRQETGPRTSARLKEVRRRRARIMRRVLLALFIVGLITFIGCTYRSSAQVQMISVAEARFVNTDQVKATIEERLQERRFGVISGRYAPLVPERDIEKAIRAAHPSVTTASVTIDDEKTMFVLLTEREPYAIWCSQSCVYMDRNGLAFAPQSAGIEPTIRSFVASSTPSVGSIALDRPRIDALEALLPQLARAGLDALNVEVNRDQSARIPTAQGPTILVSFDTIADAANNLGSALKSSAINPSTIATLEYIDLRFEGRIFYKERE